MEGANPQILKMAAEIIHDQDRRATTTVCVTGASGYVASWLVKCLLNQGYIVHATVRDPENEAKVRHLLDIPRDEETLKLFRAELSEDGSFDAAVAGCAGVFHVASPTEFAPKDPENDVIKPAVEGTLNVLQSCTKAKTVKRVVVTSSAAALAMKESEDQNQYMDESCWTDVDFVRSKMSNSNWAYRVSKTLAEQAALQYGKEDDLDVVTIIPVIVVGPSITPTVPISVQLALSLLTGIPSDLQVLKELQLPSGALSLVHVDDLCKAHIFLMENPSTEGRYICNAMDIPVAQLAHYLSKRYPEYNVPTQFEDVPVISKLNPSSKKLVESGFSFKLGLDEIFDDAVKYLKMKGMLN
jgi:anthocyanidin reductase